MAVKNKSYLYILLAIIIIVVAFKCSKITKITDVITKPSARQLYERNHKKDQGYELWQSAYLSALAQNVAIPLPYGEKGSFSTSIPTVYSYTVDVKAGEILTVTVEKDSVANQVFIDLFELKNGNFQNVQSSHPDASYVAYPAEKNTQLKVVIQPELSATSNFFININKKPQLNFPVSGKGNASVQSFWSDERDGGKRKHEGIDIFAKRGTPVIAATDGMVTYAGEKGLGGKQVWVRSGIFGHSIYYAHLDSVIVSSSNRVKTGDTIGLVGNTGNARTTAPHLHFGIYGGNGAIDPLPYVYQTKPISGTAYERPKMNTSILRGESNIRSGPATDYDIIAQLQKNDSVFILGRNNDWMHIRMPNKANGFIHQSLLK